MMMVPMPDSLMEDLPERLPRAEGGELPGLGSRMRSEVFNPNATAAANVAVRSPFENPSAATHDSAHPEVLQLLREILQRMSRIESDIADMRRPELA